MKRLVYYFLSFIFFGITFSACTLEGDTFDQALLIGKWVSGTVHYRYDNGGTGATWDTADDVQEAEAQEFSWTLVRTELTQIHLVNGNPDLPKIYTVTKLTDTSLEYEDSTDGTKYSFTKE